MDTKSRISSMNRSLMQISQLGWQESKTMMRVKVVKECLEKDMEEEGNRIHRLWGRFKELEKSMIGQFGASEETAMQRMEQLVGNY